MNVRNAIRKRLAPRLLVLKGRLNALLRSSQASEDVVNYESMCEDNCRSAKVYQAGQFWARFNRVHKDVIRGGGLANLRNQYFNRTFAGPEPESRQVYRSLLYLYFKHLKVLDSDGFLDREEEPSVGGADDQELINEHAVSLDFLQSVEEAYFLKKAWTMAEQPGSPRLILDLGAGYGRLAYVCRRMIPDCTYVILDLPEGLACSSSWLSRTLPGEVVPYAKSRHCTRLSRENLLRERVWTLATRQIEDIEDLSIDAFVNIYSFAEMPKEAICNYFTHLDRITKGIFYSKQRMLEQNTLDGVCIGMQDYPVRPDWRLLSSNISTLYDSFFECAYSVNPR